MLVSNTNIGLQSYTIPYSVRLRNSVSANFTRTPSITGNQGKFTFSGWIKRGFIADATGGIFGARTDANNFSGLSWYSPTAGNPTLAWLFQTAASWRAVVYTNMVFRDPSAWYHIVVNMDTSQTTGSGLYMRVWVNGVLQTLTVATAPNGTGTTLMNTASIPMYLGYDVAYNRYDDAYYSEIHYIDGQNLDATNFGQFNTDGVWIPKAYTGTYGTNGFYLPFKDGTTATRLGRDKNPSITTSAYSFSDYFDTYSGWTTGSLAGTTGSGIGVSGGVLTPTSYGTGGAWHGPTATKTLPNLGDFDITFGGVVVTNTSGDIHYLQFKLGTASNPTYFLWGFSDAWNDNDPLVTYYLQVNGVSQSTVYQTTFSNDVRLVRSGSTISYYVGAGLVGTYSCAIDEIVSLTIEFAAYQTYNTTTQSLSSVIINGTSYSSAGNHLTVNNISLSAGSTYDWMYDSPTNNYCTLTPLDQFRTTITGGNLDWSQTGASGGSQCSAGWALPSGKWYWECLMSAVNTNNMYMGLCLTGTLNKPTYGTTIWINALGALTVVAGNGTAVANGTAFAANDVLQFAFDQSNGLLWFGKNGTWSNSGVPASGTNANVTGIPTTNQYSPSADQNIVSAVTSTGSFNFGQRPFAYTPPSGFNTLCTANMPAVTVTNGRKHFDAIPYAGNGETRSVTGAQFQPDLAWLKRRSGVGSGHYLVDSVRASGTGMLRALFSQKTDAEETVTSGTESQYGVVTSLNADGFSVTAGSTSIVAMNGGSETYISWLWKADGIAVTNNAGSISSQVSANTTAGFSIVTYTGTGANATVGHGLGIQPSLVIIKARNAAGQNWVTTLKPLNFGLGYLSMNTPNAYSANSTTYQNTAPNSSVITLGTDVGVNGSTTTYVAYCFAEVAGFSKIGSYTGNGSADGPFIHCGFRPRFIMLKRTDSTGNWQMFDTSRATYNVAQFVLFANGDNPDTSDTNRMVDFLSNGIKLRQGAPVTTEFNASGGTYIYIAFAENSFGGGNISPITAR